MFSSPTTTEPFSSRSAGIVSVPVASRRAVRASRSTGTWRLMESSPSSANRCGRAVRRGTTQSGRARASASPTRTGDSLAERLELHREAAANVFADREDALVGDRVVGVVADLPPSDDPRLQQHTEVLGDVLLRRIDAF